MTELFNKLMDTDSKFRDLVVNNYEVTMYLAINTDLELDQCSEIEKLADFWYQAN